MLRETVFACRTLLKRPGYALSIVLTLAIGIGATTLMFSLVDAALLQPLPFTDSNRLVVLTGVAGPQRAPRGGSVPEVLDWRAMNTSLQDVSLYNAYSLNMRSGNEAYRVQAELVSASYFGLLGAPTPCPASARVGVRWRDESPVVVEVGRVGDGGGDLVAHDARASDISHVRALEIGNRAVHDDLRVGRYVQRRRIDLTGIGLLEAQEIAARACGDREETNRAPHDQRVTPAAWCPSQVRI